MKVFKKKQIVMLSTKAVPTKKGQLMQFHTKQYSRGGYKKGELSTCKYIGDDCLEADTWHQQHLYVISDEQINVGDYFYCSDGYDGFTIRKAIAKDSANYQNDYSSGFLETHISFAKKYSLGKVIASTNTSLMIDINCESCGNMGCHLCMNKSIYGFYDSFIAEYIKSNNRGRIITEVMVEYETNNIHDQEVMFHEERKEYFFEDVIDNKLQTVYLIENLKIYSDCITVKKVVKKRVVSLPLLDKNNSIEMEAEEWLKTKILLKSSQAPGLLVGFIEGAKSQEIKMFTYEDMLKASEYGYNFHKTTSFPNHDWEDSCIRNTQQWLTTFKKETK